MNVQNARKPNNWHPDYKFNRECASLRSDKTGLIEQGTGDG